MESGLLSQHSTICCIEFAHFDVELGFVILLFEGLFGSARSMNSTEEDA